MCAWIYAYIIRIIMVSRLLLFAHSDVSKSLPPIDRRDEQRRPSLIISYYSFPYYTTLLQCLFPGRNDRQTNRRLKHHIMLIRYVIICHYAINYGLYSFHKYVESRSFAESIYWLRPARTRSLSASSLPTRVHRTRPTILGRSWTLPISTTLVNSSGSTSALPDCQI